MLGQVLVAHDTQHMMPCCEVRVSATIQYIQTASAFDPPRSVTVGVFHHENLLKHETLTIPGDQGKKHGVGPDLTM